MNQAAAPNDYDRRHIPRVIRNAVDGAQEHDPPAGYGPAVSVQMARAHCWARYDVVVSALRSLTSRNLAVQPTREAARATLDNLFQHPAPFDADVRFPEGAVYLCLDHGPFRENMHRIKKELQRVEARGNQFITPKNMVTACVEFVEAVGRAAGMATLAWGEDPRKPVLYDRAVFEETFQLTWTDA